MYTALYNLEFREWDTPVGVSGSALFREPLGTGIYVLVFANGEEYAGQTINFMKRFTQHRHRWDDIVKVRFASVAKKYLAEAEATLIAQRGLEYRLRNLMLTSHPLGSSPLNLTINPQIQQQWLEAREDFQPSQISNKRVEIAKSRETKNEKFQALAEHPFGEAVIETVAEYVHQVIPFPEQTEHYLWTVTAMPSTNKRKNHQRLAILSIQNVEMLYIFEELENDEWLPYTAINTAVIENIPSEFEGYMDVHGSYRTAGEVNQIFYQGIYGIQDFFEKPEILQAARSLALGQMRKGRAMFSRFHNAAMTHAIFLHIAKQQKTLR